MVQRIESYIENNAQTILWALFALSVITKIILVIPFQGPIIFADELFYKNNTQYLANWDYYTTHYPPLYSLLLAPFAKSLELYNLMKIGNVLMTSLIAFPTWLLSRMFLKKSTSLNLVAISLLLPFHFAFNKMIMSENLYYTVLMFSLYFFVKLIFEPKPKWAVLTGIFLALGLLTRYYSLVLVGVYGFIYLFSIFADFKDKKQLRTRLIHIAYIAVPLILIASLYYIPAMEHFAKRSQAYTSGNDNVAESRLGKILKWLVIYISYTVCMVAPFLYRIVENVKGVFNKENQEKNQRIFFLIVLVLSAFFVFTAALHSSIREFGKAYALGRYIVYIGLPWIVFAFFSGKKAYQPSSKFRIVNLVVSSFLLYLSYLVLNGDVFKVSHYFMMYHISPFGFLYKGAFWVIFAVSVFVFILQAYYNKAFIKNVLLYALYVALVSVSTSFADFPITHHGRRIMEVLNDAEDFTVYNGIGLGDIKGYVEFHANRRIINVVKKPENIKGCVRNGCLLTQTKVQDALLLKKYGYSGRTYYLYRTPIAKSGDEVPEPIFITDQGISGDQRQYVWIKCLGHTPSTSIIVNNKKIHSVYYDDHMTANISEFNGLLSIQLVDSNSGVESEVKRVKR